MDKLWWEIPPLWQVGGDSLVNLLLRHQDIVHQASTDKVSFFVKRKKTVLDWKLFLKIWVQFLNTKESSGSPQTLSHLQQ